MKKNQKENNNSFNYQEKKSIHLIYVKKKLIKDGVHNRISIITLL